MNKYYSRLLRLFLLFVATTILLNSCNKQTLSLDPKYKLTFSKDTLLFDTVFTTIGSSTAQIKVYNNNPHILNISTISLRHGDASSYRLNVDGATTKNNTFKDVTIAANDSMYVFVEVTIDPLKSNNPVLVEDAIKFDYNGNQQQLTLQAYGQNVEIWHKKLILNDTTLSAEKPYLIYQYLTIDSLKTLTIPAGTKLYFHNSAGLVVYGNLHIDGTKEKPVIIRGDRTDKIFEDIPYNYVSNQWAGIQLLSPTGKHQINHLQTNAGYAGIFLSNANRNQTPTLKITNSSIHNFLKYGLVVQNANVTVVNTEISNTGAYSVFLSGGTHQFVHTTIANYFYSTDVKIQPTRREENPALLIQDITRIIPMKVSFKNCIITGNTSNEMTIATKFPKKISALFSHSYLRKTIPDTPSVMFQKNRWYTIKDTVFQNTFFKNNEYVYYNFQLYKSSPARNIGDIDVARLYPLDKNGNNRLEDGKPDAGAYEWQPIVEK